MCTCCCCNYILDGHLILTIYIYIYITISISPTLYIYLPISIYLCNYLYLCISRVIDVLRILLNINAFECESGSECGTKSAMQHVSSMPVSILQNLTHEDCLSVYYLVTGYSGVCIDVLKTYEADNEDVVESGGSGSDGGGNSDSDSSNSDSSDSSDSSSEDDMLFWQRGKTLPPKVATKRNNVQTTSTSTSGSVDKCVHVCEQKQKTVCMDMKACVGLLGHVMQVCVVVCVIVCWCDCMLLLVCVLLLLILYIYTLYIYTHIHTRYICSPYHY